MTYILTNRMKKEKHYIMNELEKRKFLINKIHQIVGKPSLSIEIIFSQINRMTDDREHLSS